MYILISLIGGLGLFLYGMNIMGEGLQKSTGPKLEKAIEEAGFNKKELKTTSFNIRTSYRTFNKQCCYGSFSRSCCYRYYTK